MIKLTGSEKQINWAEKLRQDFIDGYGIVLGKLEESKTSKPELYEQQKPVINEMKQAYNKILEKESESTFWIDNMGKTKYPSETAAFLLIKKEGEIDGM